MTISISTHSYEELLQQAQTTNIQVDPTDELDLVWQYLRLFGQGIVREIQLREGLLLEIFDCRLRDRVMIARFHFHLYGHHQDYDTQVNNREFSLYGSGCCPKEINNGPPQNALEATICVDPETLLSL